MGEIVPADLCFELGRRWYAGRLNAEWRLPSVEQKEESLRSLGLTSPFWSLRD